MGSRQRSIIFEELHKLASHPTADELYAVVRKRLPNISLGTVYRNLNYLAKQGLILKLGNAGEQGRFDACTNKHYHFVCKSCAKIYDLPQLSTSEIQQAIQNIEQHDVHSYELEFYGVCAACKQKQHSACPDEI